MRTFSANAENVKRNWYLVNADGKTLGRLASEIAIRLRGKHKPEFTPNADTGDYIIVINVEKMKITGNKMKDKVYYRHTGYPGGIKGETLGDLFARRPDRVLEKAVKGMLPKNPLGRDMYRKLRVYVGDQHEHVAQQPELLEIQE